MGDRASVVVYTLSGCGHCDRARALLRRLGIPHEDVRGDGDPEFRRRLHGLTGRVSVPQIVVRGESIGGAFELARLARAGVLEARVAGLEFPRLVLRRRLSIWLTARWLAAALVGGRCEPWRYELDLVDREGTLLDRSEASSEAAALVLEHDVSR